MAFIAPVAEGAAKKVATHEAKKTVKKKAEKTLAEKRKKAVSKGGPLTGRKRVSSGSGPTNGKRHILPESARLMRAPHSYAVRKWHNSLIAAWAFGNVIIALNLFNDNEDKRKVWSRFFAFNMTMVVLSWLVLLDALTEVVALFGWLIVIYLAVNERDNIVGMLQKFGTGQVTPPSSTDTSGGGNDVRAVALVHQMIPRNSNSNASTPIPTDTAPSQSNNNYFDQQQST